MGRLRRFHHLQTERVEILFGWQRFIEDQNVVGDLRRDLRASRRQQHEHTVVPFELIAKVIYSLATVGVLKEAVGVREKEDGVIGKFVRRLKDLVRMEMTVWLCGQFL